MGFGDILDQSLIALAWRICKEQLGFHSAFTDLEGGLYCEQVLELLVTVERCLSNKLSADFMRGL